MGLQGAMYSAISGLNANGNAMSVIGNNISNSNTTAYKSNRTLFSDVLAQEVSAADGSSQIGRGVNTATVDTNFSQGTFKSTSSNTDLAVDGPGFFIMGQPGSEAVNYTRDGAFQFDEQGYLVNPTGQRVQGYQLNQDEEAVGDLTDVFVDTNDSIPAKQTANVDLKTNLNADAKEFSSFALDNPDGSSNFTTSTTVYDSLGESHTLTTYFTKTDDPNNEWNFVTTVPSNEVVGTDGTDSNGLSTVAEGKLTFDSNGKISGLSAFNVTGSGAIGTASDSDGNTINDTLETVELQWNNGADISDPPTHNIAYHFDITQFFGQSEVIRQEQDGNASGNLVDVSVDREGNVIANYSNGDSQKEFRLGLAQFSNEDGLSRVGNNLFAANAESGQPAIGKPGSSVGTIRSNCLEQSNVDIAKEFTNMITTQRAYQANSRTISTTDDMLQEVINLTR